MIAITQGALICGIDEAGRGCLAGPVAAAAVVLPADFPDGVVQDSKILSSAQRESAWLFVKEKCIAWSLSWASHSEIDRFNILQATMLAMSRAYNCLEKTLQNRSLALPDIVLVDGNCKPPLIIKCQAVVKGDTTIKAIMAASIIAKVHRDLAMNRYDTLYPDYGYSQHKGYPTLLHRRLCNCLGPSPIQRKTFRVAIKEDTNLE